MKLRIMGTKDECKQAQRFFDKLGNSNIEVKYVSVSGLYSNRGSNQLFRVYIDIEYWSHTDTLTNLLDQK